MLVPVSPDETEERACPVCDGVPKVLLAIRHSGMRHFTEQLLDREFGCWVVSENADGGTLAEGLRRADPDLLVIDTAEFPTCCRAALEEFPANRVVVIGPEPDGAYAAAAFRNGAGAWITRERVAEELALAMRHLLGCHHEPCPSRSGAVVERSDGQHPKGGSSCVESFSW